MFRTTMHKPSEAFPKQDSINDIESILIELHTKEQLTEHRLFELQNEKNQKKAELEKYTCYKLKALAMDGSNAIQKLAKWKPDNKLGNLVSLFSNMNQLVPYDELEKGDYDAKINSISEELAELANIEKMTEQRLYEIQIEKESKKKEMEQIVVQKLDCIKQEAMRTVEMFNKWCPNNRLGKQINFLQ